MLPSGEFSSSSSSSNTSSRLIKTHAYWRYSELVLTAFRVYTIHMPIYRVGIEAVVVMTHSSMPMARGRVRLIWKFEWMRVVLLHTMCIDDDEASLRARCTMSDQNRGSRELRSDCEPSSELRSRTISLHQIKLGSDDHGSKFDRDQAIWSADDVKHDVLVTLRTFLDV